MNNNDFFEWFKESDMYKQIMEDYSPDLIMLGGSRNMGVANAKSDYDIVIYTRKSTIKYINCPLRTYYNDCTVHGYVINIFNYIKMVQYELQAVESLFNWHEITTPVLPENIIYSTMQGELFYNYLNNYREDLIGLGVEAICRIMHIELKTLYETKNFIAYDNKRFLHLLAAYQVLNPEEKDYIMSLMRKIRTVSTAFLSDEDKNKLLTITNFLYEYIQNNNFNREKLALLQMEELLWELKQ